MKRYRLKKQVIATMVAITTTAILAQMILPAVRVQRGCDAIGGEWILLAALLIGTYYLADSMVDIHREYKELERYRECRK